MHTHAGQDHSHRSHASTTTLKGEHMAISTNSTLRAILHAMIIDMAYLLPVLCHPSLHHSPGIMALTPSWAKRRVRDWTMDSAQARDASVMTAGGVDTSAAASDASVKGSGVGCCSRHTVTHSDESPGAGSEWTHTWSWGQRSGKGCRCEVSCHHVKDNFTEARPSHTIQGLSLQPDQSMFAHGWTSTTTCHHSCDHCTAEFGLRQPLIEQAISSVFPEVARYLHAVCGVKSTPACTCLLRVTVKTRLILRQKTTIHTTLHII